MTEEERIEWAKNHTWTSRRKITENILASSNKKTIRTIVDNRIRRKEHYYDPEKRKKGWGDAYNARNRYLYQHNEEFRELKKFRVAFRNFQKRKYQYEAWTHKYYQEYKGKMESKASIFKIEGTENYLYGFTLKDLEAYSPVKMALLQRFVTQNILPTPKYRGYKHSDKKPSDKVEEFYLVSEVEAYLSIFAKYKKKYGQVKSKEQELYLKKCFWKEMIKARETFDND